jgi:hypothetical protein
MQGHCLRSGVSLHHHPVTVWLPAHSNARSIHHHREGSRPCTRESPGPCAFLPGSATSTSPETTRPEEAPPFDGDGSTGERSTSTCRDGPRPSPQPYPGWRGVVSMEPNAPCEHVWVLVYERGGWSGPERLSVCSVCRAFLHEWLVRRPGALARIPLPRHGDHSTRVERTARPQTARDQSNSVQNPVSPHAP